MDRCIYIRPLAKSLHNISYRSLFKSIQIPLKQKTLRICVICGLKTLNEILICDNYNKLDTKAQGPVNIVK